jgi:hypothetical protein
VKRENGMNKSAQKTFFFLHLFVVFLVNFLGFFFQNRRILDELIFAFWISIIFKFLICFFFWVFFFASRRRGWRFYLFEFFFSFFTSCADNANEEEDYISGRRDREK